MSLTVPLQEGMSGVTLASSICRRKEGGAFKTVRLGEEGDHQQGKFCREELVTSQGKGRTWTQKTLETIEKEKFGQEER